MGGDNANSIASSSKCCSIWNRNTINSIVSSLPGPELQRRHQWPDINESLAEERLVRFGPLIKASTPCHYDQEYPKNTIEESIG